MQLWPSLIYIFHFFESGNWQMSSYCNGSTESSCWILWCQKLILRFETSHLQQTDVGVRDKPACHLALILNVLQEQKAMRFSATAHCESQPEGQYKDPAGLTTPRLLRNTSKLAVKLRGGCGSPGAEHTKWCRVTGSPRPPDSPLCFTSPATCHDLESGILPSSEHRPTECHSL